MPFHDRPFKGSETGERETTSMMRFPTHAIMNTSDTTMRPCVKDSPGLNRLRACETSPVLRTGLRPESISEQFPCSENGGDVRIQRHLTTSDADTTTDQSLASEGAESEDISKDAGLPCSPSGLDEPDDSQESHQSSVSEGDKLHCELPEDIPVALRTRSRRQRQDAHITFDVNDILDRSQIGKEVKELILQLIEQNEEQKNKLSSAIQSHKTIVRELQGDIAKLHKQMSSQKFKVSFPNSDRRRVKRFRPTGKSNVKKSSRSCGLSASAALLPESPPSEDEIYEAQMARVKEAEAALLAHTLWRHEYDAKGSDELNDPVPDTSELDGSAESESLSHDYKESVTDTSDNLDASTESEPPSTSKQ